MVALPPTPATPTPTSPSPAPPVPAGPVARIATRWWVVALFGVWSVVVWGVRIRNVWGDLLLSTDEKVLLTVVSLVFVVLGTGVALAGRALRRWPPTRGDVIAVGVLAGWTLGVWVSRVIDIVGDGDHGVGFVVVHVALAVVSVALGGWSWRVIATARDQVPPPAGPAPGEPAPAAAGSVATDPHG